MEPALEALDVCVHATGPYLGYARDLARMIDAHWTEDRQIRLIVFTDDPVAVDWSTSSRLHLIAVQIPHRAWPDSSMRRFEDYATHADHLTSPVVVFLDADMAVVAGIDPELRPHQWSSGIACVAHPGFYQPRRPRSRSGSRSSARSEAPRGSWEDRVGSLAFVPTGSRLTYVCGGVWMGRRREALALCAELAVRIELDALRGMTAVWHDESHLNWWAAHHMPTVLSPEFCYVEGYDNLAGLTPRVVALEKPADFVRSVKA